MPERGPKGQYTSKKTASSRIEVTARRRRGGLALPSKYRAPGMMYRRVRLSDNQVDNDARIEEYEELGYEIVRDEKGQPLMRRGAVYMRISADAHRERQRALVAQNKARNRAQAEEIRRGMRARMGGLPGEGNQVLGEGIVTGEPREVSGRELMDELPTTTQ